MAQATGNKLGGVSVVLSILIAVFLLYDNLSAGDKITVTNLCERMQALERKVDATRDVVVINQIDKAKLQSDVQHLTVEMRDLKTQATNNKAEILEAIKSIKD